MTLDEAHAHIGEGVVYRPYPGADPEEGTITSVSDSFAFVRYGRQRGSAATSPADLELLTPATGKAAS